MIYSPFRKLIVTRVSASSDKFQVPKFDWHMGCDFLDDITAKTLKNGGFCLSPGAQHYRDCVMTSQILHQLYQCHTCLLPLLLYLNLMYRLMQNSGKGSQQLSNASVIQKPDNRWSSNSKKLEISGW